MQELSQWTKLLNETALNEDDYASVISEAQYYNIKDKQNPPSIQQLLNRWAQDGDKLYDSFVHAFYDPKELVPWREYVRSRETAFRGAESWDDLKADIEENGIKNPIIIQLGKNGVAKIGEGNHRLAIALELGLTRVPVVFLFYSKVEKDGRNIFEQKIEKISTKHRLVEASTNSPAVKTIMRTIMQAGGTPYIIGGSVRDELMHGAEAVSKDIDFVIRGLPLESIAAALQHLGRVNMVGKSFGVVKATIEDQEYDFAIPRTKEVQVGAGHGDFKVILDPNAAIEDDLSRRDFTINALAKDPSGKIIDAFGGIEDLRKGIIRAVGNPVERFNEDPLRMLRAIQFATRFNFDIESKTAQAIREKRSELRRISSERIFEEFVKAWTKGVADSKKLNSLLSKLAVGSILFGVDFKPLEWKMSDDTDGSNRVQSAFVASFVQGGEYQFMRPPTDLEALLLLAKVVVKNDAEQLYTIRGIRRDRLETVREVFKNIEENKYRSLAEKLERVLALPVEPKELDINGDELMQLGLQGAQIGSAQFDVLNAIHKQIIPNEQQEILDYIEKKMHPSQAIPT